MNAATPKPSPAAPSRDELHAQDVANGALQTVEAGGHVHVVAPDPEIAGRWFTIGTCPTMASALEFIDVLNRWSGRA